MIFVILFYILIGAVIAAIEKVREVIAHEHTYETGEYMFLIMLWPLAVPAFVLEAVRGIELAVKEFRDENK